jgi:hypothetical protein
MKRSPAMIVPLLVLLLCSVSFATGRGDRTQFGRDIHVAAGEKTADLTCFHCSIYLAGQAAGDVTTFHGNIVLENGSAVAGDVTAFLGNVSAESGTQVAGDLTTFAGRVRRDSQSAVSGEVTSFVGTKWMLVMVLPPLLLLGGIIALIIWLVQRKRTAPRAPVYVQQSSAPPGART